MKKTFYTNDFEYVEKTKTMLNAIQKNAHAPSAVTLEQIIRPLIPTVDPLPNKARYDEYGKTMGWIFASL